MPHGDFSDYGALFCAVSGFTSIFRPQVLYAGFGPIKPLLDGEPTAQALTMLSFTGGLFLFMAFVLFVNRWNKINGKAGALGCIAISANSLYIASKLEGGLAAVRGWHVFAVMFFLVAMHLAFNANPMWTSAMLLEKEKKKAAKQK